MRRRKYTLEIQKTIHLQIQNGLDSSCFAVGVWFVGAHHNLQIQNGPERVSLQIQNGPERAWILRASPSVFVGVSFVGAWVRHAWVRQRLGSSRLGSSVPACSTVPGFIGSSVLLVGAAGQLGSLLL
nr:hypothetical protein CFP56_66722 [Quercus suber]